MIAWEKPLAPGQKRGNSGHVMIVAEPATKIETSTIENATIKYAEIPVIDSSSVDHFEPAQLPPHALQKHRDGVGKGCVRLILDQSNHPIGYWEGSYWNEGGKEIRHPTMTDHIGCARLMAEQN